MMNDDQAPWAVWPGELLEHGLNLLESDTDTNRRLAMISIDNAVELMIKTYLGLPKEANGLTIRRKEFEELLSGFPQLLEGLKKHAPIKLDGVNIAAVEYFHRMRNDLYHGGNGLTMERRQLEFYAALAEVLFKNLFGFAPVRRPALHTANLEKFVNAWTVLERTLREIATGKGNTFINSGTEIGHLVHLLAKTAMIREDEFEKLKELRTIRDSIIHGRIKNISNTLIERIDKLREVLSSRWLGAKNGSGR